MPDIGPSVDRLLTAGNSAAVLAVHLIDLMLAGEEVDRETAEQVRDRLDGWARDVRAVASEQKP